MTLWILNILFRFVINNFLLTEPKRILQHFLQSKAFSGKGIPFNLLTNCNEKNKSEQNYFTCSKEEKLLSVIIIYKLFTLQMMQRRGRATTNGNFSETKIKYKQFYKVFCSSSHFPWRERKDAMHASANHTKFDVKVSARISLWKEKFSPNANVDIISPIHSVWLYSCWQRAKWK